MAASTVFAMLYVGAVEGADRYLAPKQVYRMTDRQAAKLTDRERHGYADASLKPKFAAAGRRWYADNSREPIRDETRREGLIAMGAVISRPGVPTTSSAPRYSLTRPFAALFDPNLTDADFNRAVEVWQNEHLSKAARSRVALARRGIAASAGDVLVTLPSGESKRLEAGPSAFIAKAVVEEFAPRFLDVPGLLWLSESGTKVHDEALAASIGLVFSPDKNLPDLVLVDRGTRFLLVFVEIVATDGAITASRRAALQLIASDAGFQAEDVAFVTAYADRGASAARKTVPMLAWDSFAWFASEPDHIVVMQGPRLERRPLRDLM